MPVANKKLLAFKHRDELWHVLPQDAELLKEWLTRFGDLGQGSAGNISAVSADIAEAGEVFKNQDGSFVAAFNGWVIKRSTAKPGWGRLRFGLRSSRARRAFFMAHELMAQGIDTPRPLAWMACRKFGILQRECLLVAEAKGFLPLAAQMARQHNATQRAQIIVAYAKLMASFHKNGYSNRDMKHENIMSAEKQPEQLQVVDLDGVRRKWRVTCRRASQDLMRVGQSMALLGCGNADDCHTFFQAYNAGVPAYLQRTTFPPVTQ